MIPKNYIVGEDISVWGANTSCAVSSDTVICTLVVPAGNKVLLDRIIQQVIDIGSVSDIYFTLKRNGMVFRNINRIPGTQTQNIPSVDLQIAADEGKYELIATNENAGIAIACQGSIVAKALIYSQPKAKFMR